MKFFMGSDDAKASSVDVYLNGIALELSDSQFVDVGYPYIWH